MWVHKSILIYFDSYFIDWVSTLSHGFYMLGSFFETYGYVKIFSIGYYTSYHGHSLSVKIFGIIIYEMFNRVMLIWVNKLTIIDESCNIKTYG